MALCTGPFGNTVLCLKNSLRESDGRYASVHGRTSVWRGHGDTREGSSLPTFAVVRQRRGVDGGVVKSDSQDVRTSLVVMS
jgi:hypothetical protein